MKKYILIGLLSSHCLIAAPQIQNDQQPCENTPAQPSGMDKSTEVVLKNFLQIILSFFNILQNPKNPQNVAVNVGTMVMHMTNIAQEATRLGLLPEDYTPEDFARFIEQLDDETKEQMAQTIIRARSMQ